MRLFVSVGTHAQPFDRLLREIDALLEKGTLKASVFAQTGNSNYTPKNFPYKMFVEGKEYDDNFKKADIVVSHGGAGTIINALRAGKKLVIVPRLKRFGEHTNDHQLDLAVALEARGKAVAVREISKLGEAIAMAEKAKQQASSEREGLIKAISGFLYSMEKR